jgi:hypothetical protein
MNKRILVAGLAILVLTSVNAYRVSAQSCPNQEAFGVRPAGRVDNSLQSRIEVTYFNTKDANAFMSEAGGMSRSASYARLDSDQFVAKMKSLVSSGVASIRKQQSAAPYLGQTAELNLERQSANASARIVKAIWSPTDKDFLSGLERETEVTVSKASSLDGPYYRLSLLSWFVDVTARGGQKVVDYDASVLLKPGETAVFKLMSDDEGKRSGAGRNYVAVTMRSVDNATVASLARTQAVRSH